MNETKKGFIQLHLSVLLAGFTGLFGRLITLNEVDIVWYRMLFTSCILLVFTGLPRIGWRKFLQLCGCGALLGLHWMLFYGSIKASNVSIGVICFSLIGFFTAVFEPMIFKKRFSDMELLFSLITVVGVLCSRLRPLCHLQQKSQRGHQKPHGTDVPDVRRTHHRFSHDSCLSMVLPQPAARRRCARRLESLVHALPRAVLHRRYVPVTDSSPETPFRLHRQPDVQP